MGSSNSLLPPPCSVTVVRAGTRSMVQWWLDQLVSPLPHLVPLLHSQPGSVCLRAHMAKRFKKGSK